MKRKLFVVFILIIAFFMTSCTTKYIEHNDKFLLQKETEHFKLNSNNNTHIEEIASFLEDHYGLFCDRLQITEEDKLKITIYPNKEELLSVLPNKSYNNNIYSDAVNDIMLVIPENIQEFNSLLYDMNYVAILLTLDKMNAKVPDYIKFGIAMYETYPGKTPSEVITDTLKNSSIPTLKEMKSIKEKDMGSIYCYAYGFIDYIVEIYGYDKLNEFIEHPNIKQTFNMNEKELYSKWIEYLASVYPSLDQTKETEHFIMKYNKSDENVQNDILTNLENNYAQLTQNLQIEPKNKVTIKLYPTLSALQKYCNNVQGQSPDIAGFIDSDESFAIVSPNDSPHISETYDNLIKVAIHEFTHILMLNLSKGLPIYLNEGLAAYQAGESDTVSLTIRYAMNKKNGYFLPDNIQKLSSMTINEQYGAVYDYGYTVIEFIVKQYGYDLLVNLLKSNGDIKSLEEEEVFYKKWIDYLKENY